MFQLPANKQTQALISSRGIVWEFITEHAPWHGGFWERLVQCVKRPLRKVLGTNCLPFRELATILAEIEAAVNKRPIAPLNSDHDETSALSPSDLLHGYRSQPPLPLSVGAQALRNPASAEFTKRWNHHQKILNSLWKRFRQEYLQYLRSAHSRKPGTSHHLAVGDICILKDPCPSRAFWPLCRVVALIGGENSDSRKRSCLVRTASGQSLRRPIPHVFPIGA